MKSFSVDVGTERLMIAYAIASSPDIIVEFKPLSVVMFNTGKFIDIDGHFYVHVDQIALWIDHVSSN